MGVTPLEECKENDVCLPSMGRTETAYTLVAFLYEISIIHLVVSRGRTWIWNLDLDMEEERD
jgi:hypothetical protein